MKFLDTNVFLRFLVQPEGDENRRKHLACAALFAAAEAGEQQITTSESVLHEVFYVLCSPRQYGLSHEEAVARMQPLLGLRCFHLPHKRLLLAAIDLFRDHRFLDFADAAAIAYARAGGHELVSYDGDFDRVPGVSRAEP